MIELNTLITSGRVVTDPDQLSSYSRSETRDQGRAAFMVEPGTTAELSSIAAWAYRTHTRMVVQGANSGLVGASVPDQSGTQGLLRMARLNSIISISPTDRAVVVEAGLTLDELNQELESHGMFFPVEVGSNPTIGGMVATNAGGARTIRHGDVRRNVLSLEAVIADEAGSTIGQTVMLDKDNSRLGLARSFLGSFGSLGVVSKVALRLALRPTRTAVALIAINDQSQAMPILDFLERRLGQALGVFELISGEALRVTVNNVDGLVRPFPELDADAYLLVEAATHHDDDVEVLLAEALDSISGQFDDAVLGVPAELWKIRHSMTEGMRLEGATIRFDLSVPRTRLHELQGRVEELVADHPHRPVVTQFGHWGDGGTHLQVIYRDGLLPENADTTRRAVYQLTVEEFGGSFSAEHGIGPYNSAYYHEFVPAQERHLASQVKAIFDPHGVWGRAPFSAS